MNRIELNAILYYADFLSLQSTNTHVTDNCKYFFVHETPINVSYLVDHEPIFDLSNLYFMKAAKEYYAIKNKFGDDGVISFIGDIAMLRASGMVDAEKMLHYIYHHRPKKDRKKAFKEYREWIENLKYTHNIVNEQGKLLQLLCSRYIAHAENAEIKRRTKEQQVPVGV